MLKANIINESLDSMMRNIIDESKLNEDNNLRDGIEDELRSTLMSTVSALIEDRIINLKQYEIALQDAIEKVFPDLSWWEVTSTNIFMDLFEKRDPWAVVDDIMNTLTITDDQDSDQEYEPELTSDDMNGGQWYESLEESKKLDEKVPNDLIRSKRSDHKGNYGNSFNRQNYSNLPVIDYENSNYKEVDADTILKMKKNGEDLSNVYVMKNGKHIQLDKNGSPTWRSSQDRGIRSNQSLRKTLDGADKIYIADEVALSDSQPEKFAQRYSDPDEREANLKLGANRYGSYDDVEWYRDRMYSGDKKKKKAIERAKQDYEDGDISRKEMERIIANNQPKIDRWAGRQYQAIKDRQADARNYAANKSASSKVDEYKELKYSIPQAERAVQDAKNDLDSFKSTGTSSYWNRGDYARNKSYADDYRKEIADLEKKLEYAKRQLAQYEAKLTDDSYNKDLTNLEDKLAKANNDLEAKTARLKALLRKTEALRRINRSKELNEDKDLSKVEGSMTNVLEKSISKINSCSTVKELVDTVKDILEKNGIDTKASQRLIKNIEKQKSLMGAFSTVYNSCLAGEGNSTIK